MLAAWVGRRHQQNAASTSSGPLIPHQRRFALSYILAVTNSNDCSLRCECNYLTDEVKIEKFSAPLKVFDAPPLPQMVCLSAPLCKTSLPI